MGRMKKIRGAKNRAREKQEPAKSYYDAEVEMDDEVDKFHKSREKISLELTDSENEDYEQSVFDLKSHANAEDDDEDSLDDEELDELAAEISKQAKKKAGQSEGGKLAEKISKQAKILRQKKGLIDVEDDEDEEEKRSMPNDWGRNKDAYYSADKMESSDEEEAALEEEEARRMQRLNAESLRPEDFGQDMFEEEQQQQEQQTERQPTMEELAERARQIAEGTSTVKLKKKHSGISESTEMQAAMRNAPELVGVLAGLKDAIDELEHKVEPILKKIESGIIKPREDGKRYVEQRHMILLAYCQSIVGYLLLQAEGFSLSDHPVIARLVEWSRHVEWMRKIDKTMEKQVNRALSYTKPDIKQEAAIEMKVIDNEGRKQLAEPAPVKAVPLVAKKSENILTHESKQMLAELERIEERSKQKVSQKSTSIVKTAGKGLAQDFDYDEAGVESSEAGARRLSQAIAEAGKRKKKPQVVSGDGDLPMRDDIGERRRKYELARPITDKEEEHEDEPSDDEPKLEKSNIVEKRSKEPEQETVLGKRRITREMETNRGLTAYRNKANKNPRKKYKTKHAQAVIRRTGQVRQMRKQDGAYEGEPTGIRTDITRSIRFK